MGLNWVDFGGFSFLLLPITWQLIYAALIPLLLLQQVCTCLYLKLGIQEFHRQYVLVPVDKAANNVHLLLFDGYTILTFC